jgi:hypothetical protein
MPITFKTTNIKIPQIARWRIAGVTDIRIASLMQMTLSGLARILSSKEYIEYEAALMNGHIGAMDEALAGKIKEIQGECRRAVPAALRALVDTVTQRRDLKAALQAAKEILDRDPDRTLPATAEQEAVAPGIPAEVINAAAEESNKIASSYASGSEGKKVN